MGGQNAFFWGEKTRFFGGGQNAFFGGDKTRFLGGGENALRDEPKQRLRRRLGCTQNTGIPKSL